jgi:UDP-glucose 4-epimerase
MKPPGNDANEEFVRQRETGTARRARDGPCARDGVTRPMRILVTGADGFLGRATIAALTARGHECAALTRRAAARRDGAALLLGDVFAPASYRAGVARFRPEALIHCAWAGAADVCADDPDQFLNVPATAHLVAATLDAGAEIILGVGAQSEYGAKSGAVDEHAIPEPTTHYGVAKRAAGDALLALCAAHGARGIWARLFAIYGPGDNERRFVAMALAALAQGRAPTLTKGEQLLDLLHVRDAAEALAALIEAPQADGLFNIGAGKARSVREVATTLRDLVAPHVEPEFGDAPWGRDGSMHIEADIARIIAVAGWRPKIDLDDGFAELAASVMRKSDAA